MCLPPRHTDRFHRAVELARVEAVALGAPALGTEHLMLGLVESDDRSRYDVTPQGLRALLPRSHPVVGDEHPPLSGRAAVALGAAHRLADTRSERTIGADHLAVAILGDPDCAAVAALDRLGVDVGDLWSRVAAELEQRPAVTALPARRPVTARGGVGSPRSRLPGGRARRARRPL